MASLSKDLVGVWRTIEKEGAFLPRIHFGTVYNPLRDELVVYGGNTSQHVTLLHREEPEIKSH